jgi:hypothetical protein
VNVAAAIRRNLKVCDPESQVGAPLDGECAFLRVRGFREALEAAGVCAAGSTQARPLALLDEEGELLAIISLVPLGARGSAR